MSQPGSRRAADQEDTSQTLLDAETGTSTQSTEDGIFRRVSRNLSAQRSVLSSAFRRALTGGRSRPTPSDEEQGNQGPLVEQRQSDGAIAQPSEGPSSTADVRSGEMCTATSAPADLEAAAERSAAAPSSTSQAAEASKGDTSPGGSTLHTIFGRLLRTQSGHLLRSNSASQTPTCLICLECLAPEDFESGEAMQLECQCRGELALRHRVCAEKWSRVKGDRICDVCKHAISNLPEVSPRASSEGASDGQGGMFDEDERHPHGLHGPYMNDHIPGSADVIFDCIRVTWVAMIICILFFEMNLAMALWTGLIVGLAYTGFARAMYRTQLAAIQREMARDRERAAHADSPAPPVVMVV